MSERCGARLFGPGQPPAGREVTLAWTPGLSLALVGSERPMDVPLATLKLRRVGFDAHGVELAWQDGAGAWACQVLDGEAARRLVAGLPPPLEAARDELARGDRRARRGAAWPVVALAVVIGLPLLLVVLFVLAQDRIVGAVAARIPASVEAQLGALTLAQVRAGTRLSTGGPQYETVRTLARRLAGEGAAPRVFVAEDDAINAFALPGGTLVVNRGLIAATRTPEELAGVLAHEIQHVRLRHGLEALVRAAGMQVLWSLLAGDLGGSAAGDAAGRLLGLKFSRDAEREADQGGFDLLVARGIDPRGMVSFFATLAQSGRSTPPALISTHPPSAEREAALAARLRELAPDCCAQLMPGEAWPPRR
ncbi:MAG: M48 family metallopeptidase [Gammaproteobacteria bacterium]